MKMKRSALLLITLVFFINFFVVAIYLNFFMAPQINAIIEKNHHDLFDILEELKDEITRTGDLEGTINIFAANKNLIIEYEVANLYAFREDYHANLTNDYYHVNSVFQFEDHLYILTIHSKQYIRSMPIIKDSLRFSAMIISAIFIIVFWVTNKQLVAPIVKLQNSIKNYKFGIKPQKTEGKTETDAILNNFVELVNDLEAEKEKQNRIIASISHDIKTPLTAILGYSERVVNVQLEKERRMEYLEKIHNKALALKELTDEFDDYLSCNIKTTLKQEGVEIGGFLANLITDYKDDLEEKNIKFIIESEVDEKMIMIVDLAKIKRIFSNTISNSVRFIDKFGKITIRVKDEDPFIEFTT